MVDRTAALSPAKRPRTPAFSAVAPGKAEVTATGTFSCSVVCPTVILGFDVSVSVTG